MFTLEDFYAPHGKGNLNSVLSLYQGAFICAQRLVSLNLKATQSLMEGNLSTLQTLAKARDLNAWQEAQRAMTERLIGQIVGYAGDFNEVVAENQQELAGLLNIKPNASTRQPGTAEPGPVPFLTAGPLMMSEVVRSMLDAAVKSRDAMLDMALQVDASTPKKPTRK